RTGHQSYPHWRPEEEYAERQKHRDLDDIGLQQTEVGTGNQYRARRNQRRDGRPERGENQIITAGMRQNGNEFAAGPAFGRGDRFLDPVLVVFVQKWHENTLPAAGGTAATKTTAAPAKAAAETTTTQATAKTAADHAAHDAAQQQATTETRTPAAT